MKKTVLSALTAAFVLGLATPQVSAAPVEEDAEPVNVEVEEVEVTSPVIVTRTDPRFDEELRDLRARVALLERESDERESYDYGKSNHDWLDKFKLTGEMRYRFWHDKAGNTKGSNNQLQVRFFPTVEINDTFTIKTRLTGTYNHMEHDNGSSWAMTYAYLQGKFDGFQINAGKMPLFTDVDKGMIADDFFSGVQFITDFDGVDLKVNGGDWKDSDYIGAEATYGLDEGLKIGAGYHHFQHSGAKSNIFVAGGEYKLSDDWSINGAYAHNNKGDHKNAYNVEGNYLGAKRSEEGSWGAFAAYRYVPDDVGIAPTYDSYSISRDKKGFEFGGTYTPMKDSLLKVSYFHGKTFNHGNARTLFARASLFF